MFMQKYNQWPWILLFINEFHCMYYSCFDQSRSLQVLITNFGFFSNCYCCYDNQYQNITWWVIKGVKKIGIGCHPTSTEGSPIRWSFNKNDHETTNPKLESKVWFFEKHFWLLYTVVTVVHLIHIVTVAMFVHRGPTISGKERSSS